MSGGQVVCKKTLVTKCDSNSTLEPGDEIVWEIVISNTTREFVQVLVEDEIPYGITTVPTVVATYTVGVTDETTPTVLPISETLTLAPGAKVTYVITGIAELEAPNCQGTITNTALVTKLAAGETLNTLVSAPCPTPKAVIAPTAVISDGTTQVELLFPVNSNGRRDRDVQAIYCALLGFNPGRDEATLQKTMDWLEAGHTLLNSTPPGV